jgi:protein regulator of cytokinesis 1
MKAFGMSESEIEETISQSIQNVPLVQQLELAKHCYESFRSVCADRIQTLENLTRIANGFFDRLGTSQHDRGEFSEVGDIDFSRERIERFRGKIQDLKHEIESRTKELESIHGQVTTLLNELGIVLSDDQQRVIGSKSLDPQTVADSKVVLESLEEAKQRRVEQVKQFAVEITHLWDLLNVDDVERGDFLRSHSTISIDVIESCSAEVVRLGQLRDERLPCLIQKHKAEAEDLWNKLHIAPESRPRFQGGTLVAEFRFFETELSRLKELTAALHPLLNIIGEREEIIHEYLAVSQSTNDAQRLLSRERGSSQQLMREERARRRYTKVLPRVEKKLIAMLKEHKAAKGTDFEWDGRPYVEKLSGPRPHEKRQTLPPSPRRPARPENAAPERTMSYRGCSVKRT